jgi:hypothetical protein
MEAAPSATPTMEVHLQELEAHGHTLVPDAIPPALLARLRSGLAERVADIQRRPRSGWLQHSDPQRRGQNPKGIVDLVRVCEEDAAFEALLDLPPAFEIAQAAMAQGRGGSAGAIRLFTGPIAHHVPPHTPLAQQSWHNDGDYLRLTFVLSDITPGGGGTGFLPASHQQGVAATSFGDSLSGPVAAPPQEVTNPHLYSSEPSPHPHLVLTCPHNPHLILTSSSPKPSHSWSHPPGAAGSIGRRSGTPGRPITRTQRGRWSGRCIDERTSRPQPGERACCPRGT